MCTATGTAQRWRDRLVSSQYGIEVSLVGSDNLKIITDSGEGEGDSYFAVCSICVSTVVG